MHVMSNTFLVLHRPGRALSCLCQVALAADSQAIKGGCGSYDVKG